MSRIVVWRPIFVQVSFILKNWYSDDNSRLNGSRIVQSDRRVWTVICVGSLLVLSAMTQGIWEAMIPDAFALPDYIVSDAASCLALPVIGGPATWNGAAKACTIPAGSILRPGFGATIAISEGVSLENFGTIESPVYGANYGYLVNYGIITTRGGLGFENRGMMDNNGDFIGFLGNYGILNNNFAGTMLTSGSISNAANGTINNFGIIEYRDNDSQPQNFGIVNNQGLIQAYLEVVITNELTGVLNNNEGGILNFTTFSLLQNKGLINNNAGATVYMVNSDLGNSRIINNRGEITSNGDDDFFSTIRNNPPSIIYNYCGGIIAGDYQLIGRTPTDVCGLLDPASEADFNGDKYADLSVGVPDESINKNSIIKAGAVHTMYGGSNGISAMPVDGTGLANQLWTQNSPDVNGVASNNEDFGLVIASGDFDGDGYSDIAIGQPSASSVGGEVNVIYGSATYGLSPAQGGTPDQIFSQSTPDIDGVGSADESFGASLTAGDFNGDGYSDLAIGNPAKDIATVTFGLQADAGSVHMIYGSSAGLSATVVLSDGSGLTDQVWTMNKAFGGGSNTGDRFGHAVAAGDFNADGYDDLAIGIPNDDYQVDTFDFRANGGAVEVLYGSPDGISPTFVQQDYIFGGINTIEGGGQDDEHFGSSLAVGDFDADGYDDLAVGIPHENVNDIVEGAGAVDVIYGSQEGLYWAIVRDELWHQDTWLVESIAQPNENFGASLATGDFNGDSIDDLAIGVPNDVMFTLGTVAGGVNVIYGSTTGLSATSPADQHFDQNSDNILEIAESDDKFGYALASGDYNGDGYFDLAIGVPYEDKNGNKIVNGGAVEVIYGSSIGLSGFALGDGNGNENQLWTQHSPEIEETTESGDLFGWALG